MATYRETEEEQAARIARANDRRDALWLKRWGHVAAHPCQACGAKRGEICVGYRKNGFGYVPREAAMPHTARLLARIRADAIAKEEG